jgi:hypothetical protein
MLACLQYTLCRTRKAVSALNKVGGKSSRAGERLEGLAAVGDSPKARVRHAATATITATTTTTGAAAITTITAAAAAAAALAAIAGVSAAAITTAVTTAALTATTGAGAGGDRSCGGGGAHTVAGAVVAAVGGGGRRGGEAKLQQPRAAARDDAAVGVSYLLRKRLKRKGAVCAKRVALELVKRRRLVVPSDDANCTGLLPILQLSSNERSLSERIFNSDFYK